MAGTNNFLQWNPGTANQENDAAYVADSARSGGAGTGSIFASQTANKLFFQISTMVAAIAAMMAAKNYNMQDGNFANLETALSNLLTNADIKASFGASGYFKIAGFIVQWGNVNMPGSNSSDNPTPFTFPTAFPSNCCIIPGTFGGADRITFVKSLTGAGTATDGSSGAYVGGTMSNNGSGTTANYIAVGN